MRICAFSLWPAPTMVFFTRFGAYSATGRTLGWGSGLGRRPADHLPVRALLAVAGADDVLFHRIRGVSGDGRAGVPRTRLGEARAWPSLSVAVASLFTKVASTAASCG